MTTRDWCQVLLCIGAVTCISIIFSFAISSMTREAVWLQGLRMSQDVSRCLNVFDFKHKDCNAHQFASIRPFQTYCFFSIQIIKNWLGFSKDARREKILQDGYDMLRSREWKKSEDTWRLGHMSLFQAKHPRPHCCQRTILGRAAWNGTRKSRNTVKFMP